MKGVLKFIEGPERKQPMRGPIQKPGVVTPHRLPDDDGIIRQSFKQASLGREQLWCLQTRIQQHLSLTIGGEIEYFVWNLTNISVSYSIPNGIFIDRLLNGKPHIFDGTHWK